jgi:hypothetical protein
MLLTRVGNAAMGNFRFALVLFTKLSPNCQWRDTLTKFESVSEGEMQ